MNRLTLEKRAQILGLLVEGNSLRATSRLADCSVITVMKFLVDMGTACAKYMDESMRNLPCKRVQVDEIWSFIYQKQDNVPVELRNQEGIGDIWTWTAIDADTKLVPSFYVGRRDAGAANIFIQDLASRLKHRVQLTSDGHRPYLQAVEDAFQGNIDFAMLIKLYGEDPDKGTRRYSPAKCNGTKATIISGRPDLKHISTSYAEANNLTMRMSMRRFTRLTNAFSKKLDNHIHAVAIHFMYYNFGRIHKTLRVTPAMEAGISKHLWTLEEIVGLLDSN